MKRRYHHFEQVFRQKLGQNLRQSSEAFSAFEAETCNCFRANSQYVEKLQWPWNSSSPLKRNSSSTNYFSNALPPPATEKVANEVNFQEFCLQISSAPLPLQNDFVFLLNFRFHCQILHCLCGCDPHGVVTDGAINLNFYGREGRWREGNQALRFNVNWALHIISARGKGWRDLQIKVNK